MQRVRKVQCTKAQAKVPATTADERYRMLSQDSLMLLAGDG